LIGTREVESVLHSAYGEGLLVEESARDGGGISG
jgi:hypothetical protein